MANETATAQLGGWRSCLCCGYSRSVFPRSSFYIHTSQNIVSMRLGTQCNLILSSVKLCCPTLPVLAAINENQPGVCEMNNVCNIAPLHSQMVQIYKVNFDIAGDISWLNIAY